MEVVKDVIHINRGDRLCIDFSIENNGEAYVFQKDDKIKFSIYKAYELNKPPVVKKEFYPAEGTTIVNIDVSESEMEIGEMLNTEDTYWYQIKLNARDTVLGFNKDGAKELILYPEGAEINA